MVETLASVELVFDEMSSDKVALDLDVSLVESFEESQVDVSANKVTTTGAGAPLDIGAVATITNIDNQEITAGDTVITIITTDATTITATAHASTTTSDGSDSGTFAIESSGSDTMANLTTFLNCFSAFLKSPSSISMQPNS